jgi:hypothetical protein
MFELRKPDDALVRKRRMVAYQVVDSKYVLNLLCRKLEVDKFLETYKLMSGNKVRSSQGVFFELAIHQCVEKNKPPQVVEERAFENVHAVCWSEGTAWKEDVKTFVRPNVYWIPNTSNFPAIDAAMVCNNTLYTFQMTIQATHEFKAEMFRGTFLKEVRANKAFKGLNDNVIVYFVVPADTKFDLPTTQPTGITFKIHHADMASVKTLTESMRALFASL